MSLRGRSPLWVRRCSRGDWSPVHSASTYKRAVPMAEATGRATETAWSGGSASAEWSHAQIEYRPRPGIGQASLFTRHEGPRLPSKVIARHPELVEDLGSNSFGDVRPVCAEPVPDGAGPRSPRPSPRRPTESQARPRRRRSIRYRIDSTMGRGCYMPCPEGESQFLAPF